jgi:hypothetical protein
MRQGRSVRTGVLCSIGVIVMLVVGQGVAIAAEGSGSLDDPSDTIADTAEDPNDTVNDVVDETTDPIEEAGDDPSGNVTDTVDATTGTIGGAAEDSSDQLVDDVANATSGSKDSSGGITEGVADAAAGPETASSSIRSTTMRGPEGSAGTRASARGPDDLDDLADSGNDVVDGSAGPVCVGSADIVCLELVGGLGGLGVLFRAAEEARDVSAFVDSLARTGIDLVGEMVLFVALMLTGIVLTSRRRQPGTTPARSRGSIVRT